MRAIAIIAPPWHILVATTIASTSSILALLTTGCPNQYHLPHDTEYFIPRFPLRAVAGIVIVPNIWGAWHRQANSKLLPKLSQPVSPMLHVGCSAVAIRYPNDRFSEIPGHQNQQHAASLGWAIAVHLESQLGF